MSSVGLVQVPQAQWPRLEVSMEEAAVLSDLADVVERLGLVWEDEPPGTTASPTKVILLRSPVGRLMVEFPYLLPEQGYTLWGEGGVPHAAVRQAFRDGTGLSVDVFSWIREGDRWYALHGGGDRDEGSRRA